MKIKNNNIIIICSLLNCFFTIGLFYCGEGLPSLLFYICMILMTINAAILVAYTIKNR